jgi:hypothetical protein
LEPNFAAVVKLISETPCDHIPKRKLMLFRLSCTLFLLNSFQPLFCQNALFIYPGGTVNIPSGATLVIKGNTYVSNGGAINNAGNIHVNNATAAVWIDSSYSAGSVSGSGKIYFEGSAPLTITGNNVFYDAVINGSPIIVDSPSLLSVSHQFYLQNGLVNTNKSTLKIVSENEDAVVPDPANINFSQSWVNGKLNRKLGSNSYSYIFPIGDSNAAHPATLINNNLTGVTDLTFSFGPKQGSDAGLNAFEGFSYAAIHNKGIWYAGTGGSITGGNFSLRLNVQGFEGMLDNQFGILSRPFNSKNAGEWVVPQASSMPANGSPGRVVSGGFAQRNNLLSMGDVQFGIGFTSAPLPVTLINLKAQRVNNRVHLRWTTMTETNNSGFAIERQTGSEGFRQIGYVVSKGVNGNSNIGLDYMFIDSLAGSKANLYRLQELNINGTFQYSKIVSVAATKNTDVIFPNPTNDLIYVQLAQEGNYNLYVTNSQGKMVINLVITNNATLHFAAFANGYYNITVTNRRGEKLLSQKILLLKN